MSQAVIEALLQKQIGLDADSIGSAAIARAVRRRMADCGLTEAEVYGERLLSSRQELEELIEEVIVPETWFFRDREPFMFLRRHAVSRWLPSNSGRKLRLLCVPCASGEEAYSMAMALLDDGLPPARFHIDAVDISRKALARARAAVYSHNSFRGADLAFRDCHFVQTQGGFLLSPQVQEPIDFHHGNVLDAHFLAGHEPYDVIFCRNLLIYLDPAGREQTLRQLHRLLKPDGVLLVGAVETLVVGGRWFTAVRQAQAFVFRKAGKTGKLPALPPPAFPRQFKEKPRALRVPVRLGEAVPTFSPAQVSNQPSGSETQDGSLDQASRLAAEGRLGDATGMCARLLQADRTNFRVHYLLGVILQASGHDEQAEECFNRVLYLNPNHQQALLHLTLLLEQRGDTARAALLRRRTQRVTQRRDAGVGQDAP